MSHIEQTEKKSPFLIRADLIGENGISLKEDLSPDWLSSLLSEPQKEFSWRGLKPSSIELQLHPEGTIIRLSGQGTFWLTCPCVRCLVDVPFKVTIDFNLCLFALEKETQSVAMDIELFDTSDDTSLSLEDDKDLTTAYYQNGIIDLASLIREQLFLDLPSYPVCSHPQGLNKNAICAMPQTAVTASDVHFKKNPFAGLANWIPGLPENEKM